MGLLDRLGGWRGYRAQHAKALPIPPMAETDSSAVEILRAWVAKGDLHCTLSPNAWEDASCWGVVLADVARHVTSALQQSGKDPHDTLARIRHAFDAEMTTPTDKPTGSFHHQH